MREILARKIIENRKILQEAVAENNKLTQYSENWVLLLKKDLLNLVLFYFERINLILLFLFKN